MKERQDFENQWRSAFENASETPPPNLWEKIEARLEEDEEDRVLVIPFWQRWQTWSVAASVAAVLLIGGISLYRTNVSPEMTRLNTAQNTLPNQTFKTDKRQSKKGTDAQPSDVSTAPNQIATTTPPKIENQQNESLKEVAQKPHTTEPQIIAEATTKAEKQPFKNSKIAKKKTVTTLDKQKKIVESMNIEEVIAQNKNIGSTQTFATTQIAQTIETPQTLATTQTLALLTPKGLKVLRGTPKKQLWVAYQLPENQPTKQSKSPSKEYWASVGVMPASYNAGVGIGGRSASSTFAFAGQNSLARTADVESATDKSSNRAMASYSVQWQGGMNLGKRWSLETGLSYLQGNSVFEAVNGFNPLTNSYINNLEAAVSLSDFSEKSKAYAQASANNDKAQIESLTTMQMVNNSYQYLQIPVQAGFAVVKPKRKLSVWLLGGVINNLFLRNSFETGQERTVTLNSTESPYRLLSLSASTGVRLQYRFHKRWATTLTGNYQRALGSTTHETSLFEARPQLLGVGAGLRYGF